MSNHYSGQHAIWSPGVAGAESTANRGRLANLTFDPFVPSRHRVGIPVHSMQKLRSSETIDLKGVRYR